MRCSISPAWKIFVVVLLKTETSLPERGDVQAMLVIGQNTCRIARLLLRCHAALRAARSRVSSRPGVSDRAGLSIAA